MAMNAAQYAIQLAALLPPGAAMQVEDGSELASVLLSLGKFLADADTRGDIVLAESDPRQANLLIAEWEASLGLPDACSVGVQTLIDRRAAILTKLTDIGGARVPRFQQLATRLGYVDATITRHRYHNCEMTCEEPLKDIGWRWTWTLNAPTGSRVVDATTESGVEDPLRTWGDSVLECVMHRESPANSTVLIAYGGQ